MGVIATTALDDNQEPRKTLPAWLWQFALPAFGLLMGNYFLRALEVDLKFQRSVFSAEKGWSLGTSFPWSTLYHLGTLPAMVAVVVALGGLLLKLGGRLPAERNFATVYLALVLAVGPGLVANLILKDHWGRPRPREVVEFGGHHAYEPPLMRDPMSHGKSFPCGHATMGFFFFAHFFIHRRRHARLAWTAFGGAMILGWLIGAARVVQGGHFVSDIWWAMGLMWLACAGLWHLTVALERRHWFAKGFQWLQMNPRTGGAGIALVVLLAALGALLATPYQRSQSLVLEPAPEGQVVRFSGSFQEGHLEIQEGARPSLKVEGTGHGMVWSQVYSGVRQKEVDGQPEVRFLQTRKGWFTELDQEMHLTFPLSRTSNGLLKLQGSEVVLPLSAASPPQTWKLVGEGDVILQVPRQAQVQILHGSDIVVTDQTSWFELKPGRGFKKGSSALIKIQVNLSSGSVLLEPAGDEAAK